MPFALTAGLSSLGSSRLVYVAGVAELVSGKPLVLVVEFNGKC